MRKILSLLTLTIVFSSCQKEEGLSLTSITIETNIDSLATPKLFRPIEGIDVWDYNMDSLSLTKHNVFFGEYNVEESEPIRLLLNKERYRMFLLADQNYTISLKDSSIVFSGDNAKGQELLNDFTRTNTGTFAFIGKFKNDTTAVLLKSHINELKTKEITAINNLLQNKEIDTMFHKLLKIDIDYYYANGIVILANYRKDQSKGESKIAYENLYNETKALFSYAIDDKPMNWSDYVMETEIRSEIVKQYSQEQRYEFYIKDSIHPIQAGIIKEQIKEPYREQLLANYILDASKQTRYEKSLITIFDEFKETYPNSDYSNYLENDISAIRDYHHKIQADIPESVTFVKGEHINSLTELLKEFKGQKLYIDVWATWCGPCKKEFSNNHMIANILEENGYKKVFISLDKIEAKDKWVELIKFYDLSGYHHLASREFFVDFEKNHSTIENAVSIPQYLIVNEKGEIVTNNAPRPGLPDEVLKIIKG